MGKWRATETSLLIRRAGSNALPDRQYCIHNDDIRVISMHALSGTPAIISRINNPVQFFKMRFEGISGLAISVNYQNTIF